MRSQAPIFPTNRYKSHLIQINAFTSPAGQPYSIVANRAIYLGAQANLLNIGRCVGFKVVTTADLSAVGPFIKNGPAVAPPEPLSNPTKFTISLFDNDTQRYVVQDLPLASLVSCVNNYRAIKPSRINPNKSYIKATTTAGLVVNVPICLVFVFES
jgi:hypothetical protein